MSQNVISNSNKT